VISSAVTKLGDAAGVRAIVANTIKELPDLLAWLPADAVVYLDPPYMLGTRTKQLLYKFHTASDELSDDDHAALLAVSRTAKCDVLISHYPCEFYSSRLPGWRCIEYETMTRGGKRRECLWCNFPEPTELHDWRFAGMNKRERFFNKRFVARWMDRLAVMEKESPRKANYIRHELAEVIARHQRRGRVLDQAADLATLPLVIAAAVTANGVGGHATAPVANDGAARPFVPPKNRSQRGL
jgi:hypothetical protein